MRSYSNSSEGELIRFDRFMAAALYGPRGYYTGPRTKLGARGDFTTTPKLTTRLAERIARWLQEGWKRHGSPIPVIELGPGDGTLARDIRHTLGFLTRRKLDYHFVEISPDLAARQQQGNQGTWHRTLAEALTATDERALILSNEFFDAFPVRIFNRDLHELHLDPAGLEHWLPAADLPDSVLFKDPPARFEVAQSVQRWFQSDLARLRQGDILTIDYGGSPEEIYHRRPLGSLRAYLHHMRLDPPETYQNPGHLDLTFDVCFPDLERWGHDIGLETVSLQTQADFLGTADHHGAGGAFKVLHQVRNQANLL